MAMVVVTYIKDRMSLEQGYREDRKTLLDANSYAGMLCEKTP